ncbi:MAG: DEAD/DEAH box helicase [Desulfobulbaceae bacterium]|nr:DEAD/DEAH box helicase [Desulfobulbaceae bacterium]
MIDKSPLTRYVEELCASPKFSPQIVCHRLLPGSDARTAPLRQPLSEAIVDGLRRQGIERLYAHQVEAMDAFRAGHDLIVATPTASGKSLIYNLPVVQTCLAEPSAHALYLFPLKALAQDQARTLAQLSAAIIGDTTVHGTPRFVSIYDGDTTTAERARMRKQPPPVLVTNPDMLHLSLLPYHDSWSSFFKGLRIIVIDEVHVYRGLFGAHLAWVLRRLKRIAAHYGASPRFIMLSATIGNPGQLAEKLIGRQPAVIDRCGAQAEEKDMLFINPWDSAAHTASQLLETALKRGLRTIVYTKSRKMTELITVWTKPRLGALAARLTSYRAGFLPEDRRAIERQLADGTLLGVISTSALELGIDIGDLDLCILVGYPGSVMATWQRSGRVGRRGHRSAVIMIGGEDALDQYFMLHPDDFFNRPPEHAALDPLNSRITRQHLHCAAAEIPLEQDEPLLRCCHQIRRAVDELTEAGTLLRDGDGHRWHASRKRPQRQFDLRGGGVKLSIIHRHTGEIIGEIDAGRALHDAHPGAIYLHQTKTLLVVDLNLSGQEVLVEESKPTYYTRPTVTKETEILSRLASKSVCGIRANWGTLRVTEQVSGFRKIQQFTGKTIATMMLDLPPQTIETEGLWLDLPPACKQLLEDKQMHFMGAIHAVEHALIAMFPLLILCDRNDIGGISCPYHEQTGQSSIFIYDGYAGGAGLAAQAYELIEALLEQTERCVVDCPCETGCPSCVHSPRCGSGNRPIDKEAARFLLQAIKQDRFQLETDAVGDTAVDLPRPVVRQRATDAAGGRGRAALPAHFCVFDLETKRAATEVGGWHNADRMGMSVGVVYDSKLDGFATYLEDEVNDLIDHLASASVIVGFNILAFDYRVLAGISGRQLYDRPSLDLLKLIQEQLGYRLSLNRLAEQTLGRPKSADGMQALRWYKQGRIDEIVTYCREDVALTRDLLLFALDNGYLLFTNKAGSTVRLPLACDAALVALLSRT